MSVRGSICLFSPILAEPLHKFSKAFTGDESALAAGSDGLEKPLPDPVSDGLWGGTTDRGGCRNFHPLRFSIVHGCHLVFPLFLVSLLLAYWSNVFPLLLFFVSGREYITSLPRSTSFQRICWPKFKVRLLERAKLDSLGRAKLDTRPAVNVDADHSTFQALPIAHPIAIPNSLSLDCPDNAPTPGPTARPTRRSGNRNRRHAEVNKA